MSRWQAPRGHRYAHRDHIPPRRWRWKHRGPQPEYGSDSRGRRIGYNDFTRTGNKH